MLLDEINYTALADRKIIETFLTANRPLPDAEYLFCHILNSQHIWIKRLLFQESDYARFDLYPIDSFEKIHLWNIEQLLHILHTQNLEELIRYKDFQGNEFVNRVHDILFHVVNHSTYHRGQVATQLRLAGITPPSTDYILFKRRGDL